MPVAVAVCAGALAAAPAARADQCAWVEPEVAARARHIVARNPNWLPWCEPCGEPAPGTPRRAQSVVERPVDHGDWQLFVDDEPVDLAYTFVEVAPGRFDNLARLAGCAAFGVSEHVRVDRVTPTGVLLAGSPAPPPAVVEADPPAVCPAAAASVPVDRGPPAPPVPAWLMALAWTGALVLGGAVGALAGALAVLHTRRCRCNAIPRAIAVSRRAPR
ncbi:MAG: hypothetical protein D6689_02120 [Deltaproteobacteria bacterium]|nr:MAG: hypothetical protein D6689_02120 [Deltaproteobacteria bacterium]